MRIDLYCGEIQLSANKPIRLNEARGVQVRCMAGIIWITVEGETEDVFLSLGQDYRIARNGLCLIESLDRGNIRLEKPQPTFRPAIANLAKRWVLQKISQTNPAASASNWSA